MAFRKAAMDGRSAVELISDSIRDQIISGALAPGQRVTQREIQETFQVSPSSAREAFRALAGEGLLDHQSHRGAVVRKLNRAELIESYRLREVVEGLAARMVAERASAGCDVTSIMEVYRRGETAFAAGDFRGYIRNNREFHDAIYRLSGSSRTEVMARTLVIPLHRIQYQALLERRSVLHSLNGHRAIAEAIISRDPQAAEEEMRCHVRDSATMILRMLPPLQAEHGRVLKEPISALE
jgi:DNA-binding GntR family transcriptional regulator